MADEYIEREAALKSVCYDCSLNENNPFCGIACADYERIKSIPSADVVPVVRCKYCVYYDTVGCSDGFGWCEGTMVNTSTHDNFFCAEGKKKEDA